MKISDVQSESSAVTMVDFENLFDIVTDRNGYYRYNLNQNLYLEYDFSNVQTQVLTHDLHWPIISYNIYGTTRLAWLLCKINKVEDPAAKVLAGTLVVYPPKELVNGLVRYLNQ